MKPSNRLIAALVFGALFLRLTTNAWVADDAYITFRVVDNIVHGFGATWNIDERVQAYTHPLWMLLHVPFYAVFGNIYLVTLFLSFACFAGAVYYAARAGGRNVVHSALCFALPLALSLPVMDYAMSGLETPLAMLLLAKFIKYTGKSRLNWYHVSLASALLLLTRLDFVWIILPMWLYLLGTHHRDIRWKKLALGALPLVAWFAFSLFYYGFIFPNTKYAKLNTGIEFTALASQGMVYLIDLAVRDAFSFLLLLWMCIETMVRLVKFLFGKLPGNKNELLLGLGGMLYATYVIAVGGDFMSGRFWAAPIFLAAWLAYRAIDVTRARQYAVWCIAIGVAALASWHIRSYAWQMHCGDAQNDKICSLHGIIDERNYYVADTGFPRFAPSGKWVEMGKFWQSNPTPHVAYAIGLAGYYAGPKSIIIDENALSDSLLARLPMRAGTWRIGHFTRGLPKGYLEARQTGDLPGFDPDLARYYQALKTITSGDLWDGKRLQTIWDFQLGRYDKNLRNYVNRHCSEYFMGCNARE